MAPTGEFIPSILWDDLVVFERRSIAETKAYTEQLRAEIEAEKRPAWQNEVWRAYG